MINYQKQIICLSNRMVGEMQKLFDVYEVLIS